MVEIFTITARHILAVIWIGLWSIGFLPRNENDHYTYADRWTSWIGGLVIGFSAALVAVGVFP